MGNGLRRLLTLCASVLILLALAAPLAADQEEQNPSVTIKVKGAYGDYSRPGIWAPLLIEVSNQGPDIKGKLRLNQTVNNMGPAAGVDYVTPAVLPQGSTKQFQLTVPVNNFLNSIKVELVTGTKVAVEGRGQFTYLGPEQMVVGLIDRNEDGFSGLGSMKLSGSLSPVLLNIKSSEISAKPEVLSLFNVLVVDDVNLKLNDQQAKAVTGWVSRGGTLVVGGGPGWQKVYPNLPAELPKVKVSGEESRTLTALPNLLSKQGLKPPAGAVRTLTLDVATGKGRFVDNAKALVVEEPFGAGRVLYLAFDPALEPMAGWSGSQTFWGDLLNVSSMPVKNVVTQVDNQGMLLSVLNNIPAMELPSIKIILVFLGIYLLVVSIINYLVLKRLDRREWTWLTLPVLSLLFVVVLYFTSFQSRPSDVISNQIAIVDVNPDSQRAALTTATGIFAPTYDNYKFDLTGDYLVNPLPGYDQFMALSSSTGTTGQNIPALVEIEQSPGQTSVELKKMRSWNMRGFMSSGETTLAGAVTAEISLKEKKWVAVVINNTQYDFTEGVVISNPFWFAKTKELRAGGKVEVEIPEPSLSGTNGPPLYYQIYQPGMQRSGAPSRPQAEEMLRQQVLMYLFEGSPQTNQVMFIGWSKQPVEGSTQVKQENMKRFFTTVFKVPLKLKINGGNLDIPRGIITGRIIDSSNIGGGPPGTVFLQPNSQVTYQFDLPEGNFTGLQISMQTGDFAMKGPVVGSNSSINGYFLYDWDKQTWQEVQLNSGSPRVKDYAPYLGPERQMRLKVVNGEGAFQISGISIALGKGGGN
ncbi:MAG: hypothetical protein ACYC2T_08985 [Bacillota bacterium]